jgi:hypothetical protein
MALNPPISMAGVPLRVADEFILLERDGTEIEVKVNGMKTLSGKGKVGQFYPDLLDLGETCFRQFQVQ